MKNLMSRIILLPTATGVFWFITALALLATAIGHANNLVFALAFILLAIWLTAAWQCRRNLRGLAWRPAPEATAFAGETLRLASSVHGPATLPSRATLELSLPAPERGRRRIGGLHLLSPHPLGLWQARRAVPDMTALIHPRPAGGQALPGKSPHPAHPHQEAGDFRGVRTDRPGDPPRRINWRLYGRHDEPAVNDVDGGHGGQSLWLDIAACEGEVDTRLSQLCQWIREAERRGLEYGPRFGNGNGRAHADGARPGQGRAHLDDCPRRLALYGGERPGQETTGPAPAAQPGGARS